MTRDATMREQARLRGRVSSETELASIVSEIRACQICVITPKGNPLPHPPRPVIRVSTTARIAICGQAPGIKVHESGLPFSDRSGDRLRSWMGVTSDQFYDERTIATIPMGFCFPGYDANGSDLPPRPECAPRWRAAVFAHMTSVNLLLAIGGHAISWHLPDQKRRPVSAVVADWHAILTRPNTSPAVFTLPHPSWRNTGWLKRNPWFELEVLPTLRERIHALLPPDHPIPD